jgi:predicted ATPase
MKQFDSFRLDTANECLWRSGTQIALPPKPFAILRYLVENPARLITHDELLDELWPEVYVQPQVLRTYMLELRKVLGDDAGSPRFIQTVPKRGYCFVAAVSECSEANHGVVPPQPESSLGFVNREPEMRRLLDGLQSASAARRQVVFVTGAAGIGKTALLDAFVRQASPPQAVMIARGQCIEALGSKEEYYPVIEALAALCSSSEGERACRILARMAPHWLPAVGSDPKPAVESLRTDRLPGELCAALEELAAEKPLLLVFEDLQWADNATLGVISALARRRTPARLMLLGTYCVQDGSADHPLKVLKHDLLLRRLCFELTLDPLDRRAVGQLLASELGQPSVPAGLDEFIYRRSEGNPLFVKAMLEHLMAQGYLVRAEGGEWRQGEPYPEIESGVPDELSEMIELEIASLGGAEQRLLEAASLVNVAFPAWAVAAALQEDATDVEERCDELARRLYFVRRAGQDELPDGSRSAFYVFAHGLYREVLYQRQSATRRAQRHTRIAERLAQLFSGREVNVAQEMAMHYEAAGSWLRAAEVLCSAARNAHERRSHSESAALYQKALRLAENLASPRREMVQKDIRAEVIGLREVYSVFTASPGA